MVVVAAAPSLAVHPKVPEEEATTDGSASSEVTATTVHIAAAVTVEAVTKSATPTMTIAQIDRVTEVMPIWATMMTLRHRQQT